MEYYLVIKSKEITSHKKTWRECKCMLLNERNQSEKATYYVFKSVTSWKRENYRDFKKIMLPGIWREVGMNRWSTGDFWDSETIQYVMTEA